MYIIIILPKLNTSLSLIIFVYKCFVQLSIQCFFYKQVVNIIGHIMYMEGTDGKEYSYMPVNFGLVGLKNTKHKKVLMLTFW